MFSYPMGSYLETYRNWLEQFIESLGEVLLKNTFLRLYPIDYDGGWHERIKNRFPDLATDPG